jgi:hypothetical protein
MRSSGMPQNISAFFQTYADLYNRALGGEEVYDDIMDCFAKEFIAAGPEGVSAGKQGGDFRMSLDKGYEFYREIGTKKMTAKRVETTPIDSTHVTAKVFYKADYVRKDGTPLSIDFDLAYFLDTSGPKPKIFGFVAGDEMQIYRDHGLLPAD